ncbi:SRPBCC family protein [Leucobacter weissii]|uniref:SRPBCC family protein n=1 Tax=Leucobacter weissii TaxID=1983706 RepID=A0A939MIK7_9MICO|nr:SRPBCC family protein [Leucobacter weissii]MBO1901261.1 SRPBCC family protein [Leucobacter weissii]
MSPESRIVTVERLVRADPATVFELIADPARQPEWDGNDNLREAAPGQRVRAVGDVFEMRIHTGDRRENRVVEFEESRRIAWLPAPPGHEAPGHLWRWEIEPAAEGGSLVRHSYDWSELTDPTRFERARANTPESLQASVDRLAALAEASGGATPTAP